VSFGLQIRNAAGVLTFDSTLAIGGVCLGFITVPGVGGVYNFTDMVGCSAGRAVPDALYGWDSDYTVSLSPHLSFSFPNTGQVRPMALFAL